MGGEMITISLRPGLSALDLVEALGFIPGFLDEDDPRLAAEQFNENYIGGWRPQEGFKLTGKTLTYPGDPPMQPICVMLFHDEEIYLYPYSYILIKKKDGSFEICRMD